MQSSLVGAITVPAGLKSRRAAPAGTRGGLASPPKQKAGLPLAEESRPKNETPQIAGGLTGRSKSEAILHRELEDSGSGEGTGDLPERGGGLVWSPIVKVGWLKQVVTSIRMSSTWRSDISVDLLRGGGDQQETGRPWFKRAWITLFASRA